MTVTSRSHHTPLGASHLPVEVSPLQRSLGTVGAGGDGRRTIENVGFDHSYLNMEVKVLMILPGLGACGVSLCPVTVADGTLSLCHLLDVWALLQALRLPWVGFPHCPSYQNGWEEKGREKEDEKTRRDSLRRKCRAGSGVIQSQMSRQLSHMHAKCLEQLLSFQVRRGCSE